MNLRLLQISDSALPIGGFAHSWGLEAALQRKSVTDAASLEVWTREWLVYSFGSLEGVVAGACCRSASVCDWSAVAQANDLLGASIAPPTLRNASREMGEQLLSLSATWEWSSPGVEALLDDAVASPNRGPWHHAAVFGVLGALAQATALDTVAAYFHQAVLGMVGAGVRAIPVGHTRGQQILAYLQTTIEDLAAEMSARPLHVAGSGTPFYEVLCDEQTRLYSRMFRS